MFRSCVQLIESRYYESFARCHCFFDTVWITRKWASRQNLGHKPCTEFSHEREKELYPVRTEDAFVTISPRLLANRSTKSTENYMVAVIFVPVHRL
ncbi:hypothetical protein B566_EDAN007030 [Ephemera danica]|nr:hypothetical protein B566_EDAN007030 [Ephemera danica]